MRELNAIMAIAYRDLLKFLRDPARMVSTFVFPVVFIGALGGSLQATFGRASDFNLLTFTFTGVRLTALTVKSFFLRTLDLGI